MAPSNKEMQLRKTCELYVYLLVSLDKEIPEHILECASSYDYPVNCASELVEEIKSMDEASLNTIINTDSSEANDLKLWWEMSQEADRLHKLLA